MKINKTHIYIAIAVLVLLVAIGVYFYKQGKKQISIQSLPGELPGNPGSGNITGASNDEIKLLASELYDDMEGLNLTGHDMKPYQRALALSDTDLVKLYNAFNSMYQLKSGETLNQWITNEKYYNSEVTDTILARFSKLNLL